MKRNEFGFFFLTVLLLHLELVCQTVEPSRNVQRNNLQLEFETTYSVENESVNKTTSWNIPNILMRYGVSDNIELQLHTPFTKVRCFENGQLTSNIFEFKEMEFGVSVNLWKQNKLIPEAAIMARIVSSTQEINTGALGNIVSLNFLNAISNKISFNYNIGTTTNIDKNTFWFYVMNISYELNSKTRFFVENTGMFNENTESSCLGTGFGFNLNSSFAIDFSIANSLNNKMFYGGAIVAWVINTKKKG
ncbi:transporter [Gaetbulibacter aquiaggeris]|uniref:Transporter n=1 Tax=Gaetbulibacter aquiaggeris TaxID=1735373 RepID=A0ABW7MPB0_9FLAO